MVGVRRLGGRPRGPRRDPARDPRRGLGGQATGHRRSAWPPTPSPRPSRWPRPSAGSATGSTRRCSAARPTCRGAWRSIRSTGRRATSTARPSTRRSLYEALWNLALMALLHLAGPPGRRPAGPPVRRLRPGLRPRPVLGRGAALRRGQPDPRRPGEPLGQRRCSSLGGLAWLLWPSGADESGRRRRDRGGDGPTRSPTATRSTAELDVERPVARCGRGRRPCRPGGGTGGGGTAARPAGRAGPSAAPAGRRRSSRPAGGPAGGGGRRAPG